MILFNKQYKKKIAAYRVSVIFCYICLLKNKLEFCFGFQWLDEWS